MPHVCDYHADPAHPHPHRTSEPDGLQDKTLVLAREFETEANKIDVAIFFRRADPRAVQGGAIDEKAERLRALARKLRSIASAVE